MPLNERLKKLHEMHCPGCGEYGGHGMGAIGRPDEDKVQALSDQSGTGGSNPPRLHQLMEGLAHFDTVDRKALIADFMALDDEEVLALSRMINDKYGACGDDSMFTPSMPFLCSLDSGHTGPHEAWGDRGDGDYPIAVWDRGTGTV